MEVWRICRKKHVPQALSGIGAEKAGGRWNPPGRRMAYTSSSLSLAALELFVHLEPKHAPHDLYAVRATIPEHASIENFAIEDLPKDWRDYPAPAELQDIGAKWLDEQLSLVLIVPSAVNPVEVNCLLNPAHPEFAEIRDVHSQPFHFDRRMWKW